MKFCVSLIMVYVDTVSYVASAIISIGPHLVGVGGETGLMACLWGQP